MHVDMLALLLTAAAMVQPVSAVMRGEESIMSVGTDPTLQPMIQQIKAAAKQAEKFDLPCPEEVDGEEQKALDAIDNLPVQTCEQHVEHVSKAIAAPKSEGQMHAEDLASRGEVLIQQYQKAECETQKKLEIAALKKKKAMMAKQDAMTLYQEALEEQAKTVKAEGCATPKVEVSVDEVMAAKRNVETAHARKLKLLEEQQQNHLETNAVQVLSKTMKEQKIQMDQEAQMATESVMNLAKEATKHLDKMSTDIGSCAGADKK